MGFKYSPEPDHHNNFNLEPSPIHSDTEEEELTYDGYTLLNFVNHNFVEDSDADDNESSSDSENNEEEIKETVLKETEEEETLAEPSTSNSENKPMNEEHINEIKTVMSTISIPHSSFPDWAKDYPESEWVQFLKEKIDEFHKK